MSITTGKVLKYTLLPGIVPRITEFISSGFARVAFFMAYMYGTCGLLPRDHAYLAAANMGRFGIFHVMGEAHRNLIYKRQHIDQIIVFYTMALGVLLLFLQFTMLVLGLAATAARAGGLADYYRSFFVVDDPTYDVSFMLLDRVFGIPGLFNSCVAQGEPCRYNVYDGTATGAVSAFPTIFHESLHSLFHFYNTGILVIALIVFLYYVVVIVGETARDGVPFGRRFNHVWAPVRLFIAIGMLVPLTLGFNGVQLLTLNIVKWGSNMATNGWNTYLEALTDASTPMGVPDDLVPHIKSPPMNALPGFMFVASTCALAEEAMNNRTIRMWQVGGELPSTTRGIRGIDAAVNYALANNTSGIKIRFGEFDSDLYPDEPSNVSKHCGELTIPINAPLTQTVDGQIHGSTGARYMINAYYNYVRNMWAEADDSVTRDYAEAIIRRNLPIEGQDPFAVPIPDREYTQEQIRQINEDFAAIMADARSVQVDFVTWINDYSALGWAGAGIWYNKIAEINGGWIAATYGMPTITLYPSAMEAVRQERLQKETNPLVEDRFNPVMPDGERLDIGREEDNYIAFTLYHAHRYWGDSFEPASGNVYIDTIKAIFGLEGLFNMRENFEVHPMAQLVAVGRSLVESAIINLGVAFGAGVLGGLANVLEAGLVSSVGKGLAGFAGQVALIGLGIGIILFYIIPFMPFLYFFFAVAGWVKGVFEAMVGLPLWAIAHIRIDGEGIPGPAAMNGYFLILELFLRPILILFGLLGGITIFAAQVTILNTIWDLVLTNLAGADGSIMDDNAVEGPWGGTETEVGTVEYIRGFVDQFFYTVIYTIVVYMIGMSSFKLVDQIPNYILRWIGAQVSTFAEQTDDAAGPLVQYVFMGSNIMMDQGRGALSGLMGRHT